MRADLAGGMCCHPSPRLWRRARCYRGPEQPDPQISRAYTHIEAMVLFGTLRSIHQGCKQGASIQSAALNSWNFRALVPGCQALRHMLSTMQVKGRCRCERSKAPWCDAWYPAERHSRELRCRALCHGRRHPPERPTRVNRGKITWLCHATAIFTGGPARGRSNNFLLPALSPAGGSSGHAGFYGHRS